MGHTRFATLAHVRPTCGRCLAHIWATCGRQEAPYVADNWPICGNQQVQKCQSRGTCMEVNRHRTGPCVAIVLAHNRATYGNQQVHKWQSRGAYLTVNRHRSGPCVAVVSCIQKAHIWLSKGTYMAVNGYIRSGHTHIVHTWQLFVHTKGTELAIKRSRN